jgi:hypothetical protein
VTDTEAPRLLRPSATPVLKPMLAVGYAIHHGWIRAASVVASCSP